MRECQRPGSGLSGRSRGGTVIRISLGIIIIIGISIILRIRIHGQVERCSTTAAVEQAAAGVTADGAKAAAGTAMEGYSQQQQPLA
jgi:hypothetical protein